MVGLDGGAESDLGQGILIRLIRLVFICILDNLLFSIVLTLFYIQLLLHKLLGVSAQIVRRDI